MMSFSEQIHYSQYDFLREGEVSRLNHLKTYFLGVSQQNSSKAFIKISSTVIALHSFFNVIMIGLMRNPVPGH